MNSIPSELRNYVFINIAFDEKRNLSMWSWWPVYVCVFATSSLQIRYLKVGILDAIHTWYVDLSYWEEGLYGFWLRSKVTRGQNLKTFVNTIFCVRKYEYFVYVACSCVTVSRRMLLYSVKVKCHLRPPEVKLWKTLHMVQYLKVGILDTSHTVLNL